MLYRGFLLLYNGFIVSSTVLWTFKLLSSLDLVSFVLTLLLRYCTFVKMMHINQLALAMCPAFCIVMAWENVDEIMKFYVFSQKSSDSFALSAFQYYKKVHSTSAVLLFLRHFTSFTFVVMRVLNVGLSATVIV